jgi:hypothetical protein
MVDAEILAYYACGLERDRLASGRQRIEFPRIWDLLERCLPAAPATVVDVGGGAGIYAIPLASAGYEVHLVDPVPLHVEQAAAAARQAGRQAGTPLASISAGDARDLPIADDSGRRLAARPASPPHQQGRPHSRATRGPQDPPAGRNRGREGTVAVLPGLRGARRRRAGQSRGGASGKLNRARPSGRDQILV